MTVVKLPHRFDLRHYQRDLFEACLINGKKRLLQCIHRRAGKDFGTLQLCIALLMKRVGTCLYLLPAQTQSRKVIWDSISEDGIRFLDYFPPQLIEGEPRNSDMQIRFKNGSIFQLGGSDNYNSFRGMNPIVIVFSEYAKADPGAWLFLSPILTKNKGVAIFCYTPWGENHGYHLYNTNKDNNDWFVQYLTIDDTHYDDGSPIISEKDIQEDMRAGIPRSVIDQEYYLDWYAPLVGAFYVEELRVAKNENRIRDIQIDPKLSVMTGIDLGMNDHTAIWFAQAVNKEIRFVHYYENRNVGLEHYIDYMHKFAAQNKIQYSYHFAPFDINVRELGTGKTRLETAFKLGIRFTPVPNLALLDGIEQVRLLFNRFWFNEKECAIGLNCLRCYHRKFIDSRNVFNAKPVHDFSEHGASALRYLCLGYYEHLGGGLPSSRQRIPQKFNIYD